MSSETNDQASSQVYYQQDALGSTVSTLNSAGSQPEHYSYTAFGQPLTSSGATPEFGFMGEETNPASETDNFHARSYSAADGSFLSLDPLAGNLMLPQSLDQYVYGGDNPFANPDPFGESWLGDAFSDFVNVDAGAVDWLTFGATADARDALGDNNVDTSSAAYEIGEGVGAVAGEFLPVEDELETARIVERGEEATDDVEDLPTLEIDSSKMPNIADNITQAIDEGQPSILTKTDPATRDANRTIATSGFDKSLGSPDEYPFASTVEGGAGARVQGVPSREQSIQGGIMTQFYRRNNIQTGDQFKVVVR